MFLKTSTYLINEIGKKWIFFYFLPGFIASALHQTQTKKNKQTNKYLIFSVNVLYNRHTKNT